MDVHPGKQYEAIFIARNLSREAIVGNAAPSIAPNRGLGFLQQDRVLLLHRTDARRRARSG